MSDFLVYGVVFWIFKRSRTCARDSSRERASLFGGGGSLVTTVRTPPLSGRTAPPWRDKVHATLSANRYLYLPLLASARPHSIALLLTMLSMLTCRQGLGQRWGVRRRRLRGVAEGSASAPTPQTRGSEGSGIRGMCSLFLPVRVCRAFR